MALRLRVLAPLARRAEQAAASSLHGSLVTACNATEMVRREVHMHLRLRHVCAPLSPSTPPARRPQS